ncbi:MAG: hypothetical protein AAF563_15775 [Pseudomonadota bacterium]
MRVFAACVLAVGIMAFGAATFADPSWAREDNGHASDDHIDFAGLMAPSLGSDDSDGDWIMTDWYAGMVDFDDPVIRTRYDRGWREETGLTRIDLDQVFVGNVAANAQGGALMHNVDDPADPLASFSATAIANVSDVSICEGDACGETTEGLQAASSETQASPSIDFAGMMAPSLGSGPGAMTAYILVDLIVAHDVRTSQVLVGHVDAYAAVDSIVVGPAVENPAPVTEVPEVTVAATAVGNVGTLESDMGVRGESVQIVVGAILPDDELLVDEPVVDEPVVDEPVVETALAVTDEDADPLSGVLIDLVSDDHVEKAQITAEASVGSLAGVFTDVSATALANLHTTHIDVGDVGDISAIDVDQLAYADAMAIVHLEEIALEHTSGLRVAATALGNIRNVVISVADGIETGF